MAFILDFDNGGFLTHLQSGEDAMNDVTSEKLSSVRSISDRFNCCGFYAYRIGVHLYILFLIQHIKQ